MLDNLTRNGSMDNECLFDPFSLCKTLLRGECVEAGGKESSVLEYTHLFAGINSIE